MVVVDIEGDRYRGRAIDLRNRGVTTVEIAAAIEENGEASETNIHCPEPGAVHRRVGVIEDDRSYPIRAALAATARVLGHEASQADEIEAIRRKLDELTLPSSSTVEERRALADAGADADRIAERVATLRGKVQATEGVESDERSETFRSAAAKLTELRTERIAAEQALERARKRAREARDRREQRLRLQDRKANLERAARRELAAAIEPSFERALAAVPGTCKRGERPGTVRGDETTAALAVCRIAPLSAPVVIGCDRFETASAAAAAVNGPVVLV